MKEPSTTRKPPQLGRQTTLPLRESGARKEKKRASWRRSVLSYRDEMPGKEVYWLLAYAALYLVRPWEIRPELAALPMERIFALLLLVKIFVFGKAQIRLRGPGLGLLFFVGALFVTMFAGLDLAQSWIIVENVLKVSVFGICVIAGIRGIADLRAFLLGWVGIQFIYQLKAIWEFYIHGRGSYQMGIWRMRGIESTFGHPNTFCATTVLILPFAIALLRNEKTQVVRALLFAEIVAAGIVIFKTGSRAGLIEVILLAMIVLVSSRHRFKGILVLSIVVPIIFLVLPDDLSERYRTIFDKKANKSATESAQGRIEGLKKGAKLFVERPLVGVGPNCFTISDRRYPGFTLFPGLQPHNLVGQVLGETGLLGVLSFGIMVFATFLALVRIRRRGKDNEDPALLAMGQGGLLVLFFLFIAGTFGHNLYRYNWIWLTALTAAAWNAADLVYPPKQRGVLKVNTIKLGGDRGVPQCPPSELSGGEGCRELPSRT